MIDVNVRLIAVGTVLGLTVTGEHANLALRKKANASSVYTDSIPVHPGLVTDGSDVTVWDSGSCFGTSMGDLEPWWIVDLQEVYTIAGFMVLGRSDCCPERLQDFTAETFLENPALFSTAVASHCYFYSGFPVSGEPEVVNCESHVQGRYFRVRRRVAKVYDHLVFCEMEVYEAPTEQMCNQFTGKMNSRVSHGKPIAAESIVHCAAACTNMLCLAFNFRWAEVPKCQIVPQINGEPEYDKGWRFYKRNENL